MTMGSNKFRRKVAAHTMHPEDLYLESVEVIQEETGISARDKPSVPSNKSGPASTPVRSFSTANKARKF